MDARSEEPVRDTPSFRKRLSSLWHALRDRRSADVAEAVYGETRRREAADALLHQPALQGLEDSSVGDILLDQTKKVVDMQVAAIQALDGKAIAQIGIAGTVVGLFTAFGRRFDSAQWAFFSISPLLLAILCTFIGLYVRKGTLPAPAIYNTKKIYESAANKPKIAVMFVEIWKQYSIDLIELNRRKAAWIKAGSALFLIGLIAISVAFVAHSRAAPSMGN